jgi:hypothetical protein
MAFLNFIKINYQQYLFSAINFSATLLLASLLLNAVALVKCLKPSSISIALTDDGTDFSMQEKMQGDGTSLYKIQKPTAIIEAKVKMQSSPGIGRMVELQETRGLCCNGICIAGNSCIEDACNLPVVEQTLIFITPDKRRDLYRLYDTLLYT